MIAGYGSYVPLYRIERSTIAEQHGDYPSSGEISVPSHDEDHVTFGVKAAEQAITHAGIEADELDAVFAASVSEPFDERGLAVHVGYAVGATDDIRVGDFRGSARAATDALQSAIDAIEAGRTDTALVIATDILTAAAGSDAEKTAGAGAAALVLDADDGIAETQAVANNSTGFIGRFKQSNESPVEGDAIFNRQHGYLEAVTGAIEKLGAQGVQLDPDRVALAEPDGGWGQRVLGETELEAEQHSTYDDIGYVGAASVLLDLVATLEETEPGEQVLLVSYGPGGSDAIVFETGDRIEATPDMTLQDHLDSKEYVTYAQHRKYRKASRGDA